jgi:NAD+ kinase
MMLQCRLLRDGKCIESAVGLNDVVVSPRAMARLIDIDFQVNDQLVTTYRADGLIVSTPVGSTGHSLSAGGPIVYPGMDCFVVAPICPHTLTNRPLILPPDTELKFAMDHVAEHPAVTVDGQVTMELQHGDRVAVRRADCSLRLVRTDRRTFFETLHNKLGWGGQPAYVK